MFYTFKSLIFNFLVLVVFSTTAISLNAQCYTNSQWYSQVNSSWSGNIMSGTCTIGNSGCAVTCVAMILASASGNPTSSYTPATLNTYLKNNGGYSGCGIVWGTAANMDGSAGVTYVASTSTTNNWSWLDGQLASCRKVVVNVNNGGHWVLVTARTGTSGLGSSYKVLDPGNSSYTAKTLANFSSTFTQGRSYAGTWKSGLAYKQMEEIASTASETEYETFAVEGMDGFLVSKSDKAILEDNLNVYPNPISAGNLNVEISMVKATNASISLVDFTGKEVYAICAELAEGNTTHAIAVDNLPNGFYLLMVKTEAGILTRKLQIVK